MSYQHYFKHTDYQERRCDVDLTAMNHGYNGSLHNSAMPLSVKQEPREYLYDGHNRMHPSPGYSRPMYARNTSPSEGVPCPYENAFRFFCHEDPLYFERIREKQREHLEGELGMRTTPVLHFCPYSY
ncbi:hypothetical protein CHS0354_017887 [Potamilus streckersoni]|uniref:Uncharacterized protein n=1 Tax=Potamilus streckersoni TaxID=2493646 RepID=A0AAE0W747_9BIVA|nr:hypothetical protein CHS0354_017887 [Potamilus streckersoni]